MFNNTYRLSLRVIYNIRVQVLEELGHVDLEVAIEGKLTSRFYQKGGEKRFVQEVEINDLVIL